MSRWRGRSACSASHRRPRRSSDPTSISSFRARSRTAAVEAAWVAVGIRAGGEAALERWLDKNAIDRNWARRLVGEDIVKSKFLDARFIAFVFPDDEAVTRELGPGQHDEPAREQARERLVRQAASETQATWLADARRRASIRILLPAGSSVAPPFTLP